MKSIKLLHFPIIFIFMLGCNSIPEDILNDKSIDKNVKIDKPVKTIKSESENINKKSDNIKENSKKIEITAENTEIFPEIKPDLKSIYKSTDDIKNSSDIISVQSEKLSSLQSTINKRSERIEKLKKELKEEKDKNKREIKHLWTWLQIGGLVLVGVGIGLGFLIHRASFGIALGLSGLGITLISRFLQLYEWVLMLAVGITIVGIIIYLVYLVIIHRDSFWRELKGKTQSPKGAEVKQELENK